MVKLNFSILLYWCHVACCYWPQVGRMNHF